MTVVNVKSLFSSENSTISYERADPLLLDDLTTIVEALVSRVGIDPDDVLVVGAGSRDIMHSALGHRFPIRYTSDTDLGIAVADWGIAELIDKEFVRSGNTGIRFLIEGLPVDIMPFGGIEDPDGIATPASRGEELVVFGFMDVYERAAKLPLPNGHVVRIPSPAGYAALKLRSWIDRSSYGEDKDAKDLAIVTHWYAESTHIADVLYETGAGLCILDGAGWDVGLASAQILGTHVADQLSPERLEDLIKRLDATDSDLLARSFVLPPGAR